MKQVQEKSADVVTKPKRVLVVEDDPVNRFYTRSLLVKMGVSADLAEDGLEAIEKITSANYDLVLLDLQMPGMNGYETLRVVRKLTSKLPVVVMTASESEHVTFPEELEDLHNGFITKPLSYDQLYGILWESQTESGLEGMAPALEEYTEGDADFKKEFCELLIQNFQVFSEKTHRSIRDRSLDEFKKASHKIAFSSRLLKVKHMDLLVKQIESNFHVLTDDHQLLHEFDDSVNEVIVSLKVLCD